jgi:DNA-binding transcriptional ArsR family regulator
MNLGPPDEKITLDRRTFKVLASNTRTDILKALEGTQKTVSDLARDLNMNKATMYQHLEQLRQVGLVKRLDGKERMKTVKTGPHQAPTHGGPRKWVYYKLSWKGRNIVNPGKVRFAVMLSMVAVIGIAIALIFAFSMITPFQQPGDGEYRAVDDAPPEIETWDTPTPNTAMGDNGVYDYKVYISDSGISSKVSGLKQESVTLYYGVGTHEKLSTPDVVGWKEADVTPGNGVYKAEISDLDWEKLGGKYLYLKAEAMDVAGNHNYSVRTLYIVAFDEPDLIFGDNGVYGGNNGVYGDNGVYIEKVLGGGGSGGYAMGAQVTNIGDAEAGAFTVGLYSINPEHKDWKDRVTDGIVDLDDYKIVTWRVHSLAPGEILNLTTKELSLTEMHSLGSPPEGASQVYFVIDPDDDIKEEDDTNNVQSGDPPIGFIAEIGPKKDAPTKEGMDAGAAGGFEAIGVLAALSMAVILLHKKVLRRKD